MSTVPHKLRKSILNRLARLVERSRILELNRSDAAFLERGGEIFYVLDTNAVQAFLKPSYRPRWIRLFHDTDWDPRASEAEVDYEKLCDEVGAAASLLATEFILGSEPGGDRKHILMTVEHLAELEIQIGHFLEDLDELEKVNPRLDMERTIKRILEIAELRSLDLPEAMKRIEADTLFIPPVGILDPAISAGDKEALRKSYIISAVCRALATDRLLEPFDQIERLARGDLAGRIRPLEGQFVTTAEEEEQIAEQARFWLGQLQKEMAMRGDRKGPRKPAALPADAKALAYVSWVSREALAPGQRIVFVTGDRLILDAYRRWFVESEEVGSFVARPLAQFAPQYNLSDVGVAGPGLRAPFERTREAVESATFPVILELLRHYREKIDGASYHQSARVRDKFCLDVADGEVPDALVDALIANPLSHQPRQLELRIEGLELVAEQLRGVERIVLGMLPALVEERAQNAIERSSDLAEALSSAGRDGADAVAAKWLNERFDLAMQEAYAFALPLAAERIRTWEPPSEQVQRAPATLRLLLPLKGRPLPVEQWLAQTVEDRQSALEELVERSPALVFALASWLTFRSKAWSDAVRFADLAGRATQRTSREQRDAFVDSEGATIDPDAIRRECLYLKALALRMRMASEAPSSVFDTDVWRRDLERAKEALVESGDLHNDAEPRGTRYLRARSELAAVRLTYCGWGALGRLADLELYRTDPPYLGDVFALAVADLHAIVVTLPKVRERVMSLAAGREIRMEVLKWVSLQTAANQECAKLLGELLLKPALSDGFDAFADTGMHKIILAYKLSAERRAGPGPDRAAELQRDIADIAFEGEQLALDRAMLNVIKARWSGIRAPRT